MDKDIISMISFINQLLGTPYILWRADQKDCGIQAYVSHEPIPTIDYIKQTGINCVGLINLIRRYFKQDIPGIKENKQYAGGTYEWFKYFKKNKRLKKFNYKKSYPIGTLLLRNYSNEQDQGHMAIIYNDYNGKDVLFCELVHAYYDISDNKNIKNKKLSPGLIVDNSVGLSHFWFSQGTYTHICYPNDWIYN